MWRLISTKRFELRLWGCWSGFSYNNFPSVVLIDLGWFQMIIRKGDRYEY